MNKNKKTKKLKKRKWKEFHISKASKQMKFDKHILIGRGWIDKKD